MCAVMILYAHDVRQIGLQFWMRLGSPFLKRRTPLDFDQFLGKRPHFFMFFRIVTNHFALSFPANLKTAFDRPSRPCPERCERVWIVFSMRFSSSSISPKNLLSSSLRTFGSAQCSLCISGASPHLPLNSRSICPVCSVHSGVVFVKTKCCSARLLSSSYKDRTNCCLRCVWS